MLTIDKENLEIRISECLAFDADVQPVFEDFVEGVQEGLAAGEFTGEEDKVRQFLSYSLTNEDKVQILKLITEDYEFETGHGDCEVSLFDTDGIERSVGHWAEEAFGFTIY